MKKLIIITVLVLVYGGICKAEKPTSWVDVKNIHAGVLINKKDGKDYYPVTFYFDGMARSSDGGKRAVRSILNVGTSSTTPYALETLEEQKRFYQALPVFLRPVLLDLRIQATAEDLSN